MSFIMNSLFNTGENKGNQRKMFNISNKQRNVFKSF